MEYLKFISQWIKANPTEFGLILAAIPIVLTLIAGAYSAVQYVIVRKAEMYQKRFENYHQLIHWLVLGRVPGAIQLDSQIACIYELRNFKAYRDVSVRILEGLKELWSKIPVDQRIIKEIDFTISALRR